MRHLSDGSRVQRPAAGAQQTAVATHEATWIVQSPHLPLGRAQSRVRHDDGETSGSDHAARGRQLGPATHRQAAYTSVFITTATRHEQVHHDAPSWACASRRCARCAGRSWARCSRQIVGCRAVRPSESSGSSAIRRVQSFLTQVLSKNEQTM